MHIVLPFAPKIVERTPSQVMIHNTVEDYKRDKTTYTTSRTPHFKCSACQQTYRSESAADNEKCLRRVVKTDYSYNRHRHGDKDRWWLPFSKNIETIDDTQPHSLIEVACVTNELGDDIGFHGIEAERHRAYMSVNRNYDRRPTMASFLLNAWCSPEVRGLLPVDRPRNDWLRRYKHYPEFMLHGWGYRKVRTTQEHRMYGACLVDEFSPKIRAKRHKALVTVYDDIHAHRDRSWKRKKVKKQWMINL